jgi:hypothetical protein
MVIHRDINPQNILFGPHGEPKISDFGVAHLPVVSGGIPEDQVAYQNRVIGTPLYMAPEQISNRAYDHRVDLYAIGAVLYEMLAGKKIFTPRGNISIETMRNLIMTIEPDPIEPDSGVPPELAGLAMKLLAKKPEDRFPDARSVIIALEKLGLSSAGKTRGIHSETRVGISGPLISSPAAMLEDVMRLFLIDGSISPAERRELDRRSERLGVSGLHAKGIENKIRMELGYPSIEAVDEYTGLMRQFMSDSPELKISPANRELLEKSRKELKISREEASSLEKELSDKIKYRKIAENKSLPSHG